MHQCDFFSGFRSSYLGDVAGRYRCGRTLGRRTPLLWCFVVSCWRSCGGIPVPQYMGRFYRYSNRAVDVYGCVSCGRATDSPRYHLSYWLWFTVSPWSILCFSTQEGRGKDGLRRYKRCLTNRAQASGQYPPARQTPHELSFGTSCPHKKTKPAGAGFVETCTSPRPRPLSACGCGPRSRL